MGKAVRVSVAVVEGEEGPIALVPSQEEVICPEAVFLDAGLLSEREAARREVPAHALQQDLLKRPALRDRHQHCPLKSEYSLDRMLGGASLARSLGRIFLYMQHCWVPLCCAEEVCHVLIMGSAVTCAEQPKKW